MIINHRLKHPTIALGLIKIIGEKNAYTSITEGSDRALVQDGSEVFAEVCFQILHSSG